jgi:hypothetical protein
MAKMDPAKRKSVDVTVQVFRGQLRDGGSALDCIRKIRTQRLKQVNSERSAVDLSRHLARDCSLSRPGHCRPRHRNRRSVLTKQSRQIALVHGAILMTAPFELGLAQRHCVQRRAGTRPGRSGVRGVALVRSRRRSW